MGTLCDPHDDEKVTLPFCFLTLIVKLAGFDPDTVAELGDTCIWPLLLELAEIVPLPLKLFRRTEMVSEPFCEIVIDVGLAEREHGATVGVAVGLGTGVGVGVGPGVGVGVGTGVGVGVGTGVGVGVGLAEGVGVALGEGLASGDAEGLALGDGLGSAIGFPPAPLSPGVGIEPSAKISKSMVTSPEPEMFTLLE